MPDSASELTAPVILRRPENSIPKPMAMLPIEREFLKRPVIIRIMPTTSAIGASVEGCRKRSHVTPEESISSRRII